MDLRGHVPLGALLTLAVLMSTVNCQSEDCQVVFDGSDGQCIHIRECPSILRILEAIRNGGASSEAQAQLRSSICRFSGGVPFVCCPKTRAIPPLPVSPSPPAPSPAPSSLLPSPTECGRRSFADRVVSGEDAPLSAWPWMALLESVGSDGRISLVCGGVLISNRYVLTAAHCVDRASGFDLRSVRIGEHTINTNPDCRNGFCRDPFQSIEVEQITIHEDYAKPFGCRNCNDIALIRLSRPVQFVNLFVQPICLPQNLVQNLNITQNQFQGRLGWVAGWGTTDPQKVQPANVLQQVLLPINENLCSIDLRVFPDQNMVLCAGGNQMDTCRGDSGGPMVMSDDQQLQHYVVGIVSRGPVICGAANTGGLYTNINFYVPWIIRNLRA